MGGEGIRGRTVQNSSHQHQPAATHARQVRSPSCALNIYILYIHTPVEAAEGTTAHNNIQNGANGMASNTWKPCV
jgi:hypothetical protein